MIRTALAALAGIATVVPAVAAAGEPADTLASLREELAGPVRLTLGAGRHASGRIARVYDDHLMIRSEVGDGGVTQTFPFEQIREIELPGDDYHRLALELTEAGRDDEAVAILDLLFEQRASLLALLPPAEAHRFIGLAELHLANARAARALAIAEIVSPHVGSPAAADALEDAVLSGHLELELHEETAALAEAWLARRDAYGGSALGYAAKAAVGLHRGADEDALTTALEAIVFSAADGAAHLDTCYAVAIQAACRLRDYAFARRLAAEMRERKLEWPAATYPEFSTDDIPRIEP